MEKTIIDIIDKKAMRQYKGMTEEKRKAYRVMLYAGVQITMNGCSVKDVSTETGYSESGIYKLVQKWIDFMQKGDITVNLIISAVRKLPKKTRSRQSGYASSISSRNITPAVNQKPKKAEPHKNTTTAKDIKSNKSRNKNILGFIITPEDEMRERANIRASILFFQKYGQGRQPRLNGEYFTPGTNPSEQIVDEGKWLPLDTAALYCGCKEEIINEACQNGFIERRVYISNANRKYYEYKVSDLDRFITKNNLI